MKKGQSVIAKHTVKLTDEAGNSAIVGDVDTESVMEVASWVTPVPGGVGPVTVALLMRNATAAHRKQREAGWLDG